MTDPREAYDAALHSAVLHLLAALAVDGATPGIQNRARLLGDRLAEARGNLRVAAAREAVERGR